MKPRYTAPHGLDDPEKWLFLGYAYDLDVYMAHPENMYTLGKHPVIVTGDELVCGGLNWTPLHIEDGNITPADNDVHVGVHHLVEIHGMLRVIEAQAQRTNDDY